MQIVLLGKVIKAMYKLSGKTLSQLADETDLTVDTLNNLFYARLQKPSFFGVESVVKATGYTMEDLTGFMSVAEKLPPDSDITEEFTKYIFTVKETVRTAEPTVTYKKTAENTVCEDNCCMQIRLLNEEHEKQLDRYRSTHLHYVDELHARYKEQINQVETAAQQLKAHYDHSVGEIKKAHEHELEGYRKEISHAMNVNKLLTLAVIIISILAGVIAFVLKG